MKFKYMGNITLSVKIQAHTFHVYDFLVYRYIYMRYYAEKLRSNGVLILINLHFFCIFRMQNIYNHPNITFYSYHSRTSALDTGFENI